MISTISGVKLDFHIPTIEDAQWAAPILQESGLPGCEFSFTTIFMWRFFYQNEIACYNEFLFLRSGETKKVYLLPLGGDLKEGIALLREFTALQDEPLCLFGINGEQKDQVESWFPGVFEWSASTGDYDYIYQSEDLATLPGRKFHSKRNHIAAFSKQYDWKYEPINDENTAEAIDMARQWCKEKGNCSDPGLRSETCAIREVLSHREVLRIRGGLIRIDGKVVAMTIGSPINDKVFDIHSEKALSEFSGAYAVINREFAAHELQGKYELINRENDLDIEGLRRAKKSYNPVQILEKYLAAEIRG